ncbi:MAG: hypothetical protein RSD28_05205 [Lachnospiraceae bacterium]
MKTKQIPAIIMLIAGLVISIIGIVMQMDSTRFLKILSIVLVSFYIIGFIAKIILDKNFKEEKEKATDEAVEDNDTQGIVEESTETDKQ